MTKFNFCHETFLVTQLVSSLIGYCERTFRHVTFDHPISNGTEGGRLIGLEKNSDWTVHLAIGRIGIYDLSNIYWAIDWIHNDWMMLYQDWTGKINDRLDICGWSNGKQLRSIKAILMIDQFIYAIGHSNKTYRSWKLLRSKVFAYAINRLSWMIKCLIYYRFDS